MVITTAKCNVAMHNMFSIKNAHIGFLDNIQKMYKFFTNYNDLLLFQTTWNKGTTSSSYSGLPKKEVTSKVSQIYQSLLIATSLVHSRTQNRKCISFNHNEVSVFQYESSYTRPRIEIKKADDDKSTSRLGSKFGSYTGSYQRDTSSSRDTST